MADSEVRQKFEELMNRRHSNTRRFGEVYVDMLTQRDWEVYEAGMRAGEIAMRGKAAAICERGNAPHIGCLANSPEGNQYVPSGGTCHVAMALAIRALPLSGAEAKEGIL